MGLWLKCPGCQASNPLSLKVCPACGQDLDKLSTDQRVYVIGPKAAPPAVSPPSTKAVVAVAPEAEPAVAQPDTPAPEAGAARQPAKKPRKVKKKKS